MLLTIGALAAWAALFALVSISPTGLAIAGTLLASIGVASIARGFVAHDDVLIEAGLVAFLVVVTAAAVIRFTNSNVADVRESLAVILLCQALIGSSLWARWVAPDPCPETPEKAGRMS